jgi:GH25 family lysozyme M1 (1,4-beta-N-acetylmuramidase)
MIAAITSRRGRRLLMSGTSMRTGARLAITGCEREGLFQEGKPTVHHDHLDPRLHCRLLFDLRWCPIVVIGVLISSCAASEDGGEELSNTEQAATKVCAKNETTPGIDISKHQADVDFAAVKKSGKRFVIARTSDGAYSDPQFAKNWRGAKSAGLIRGVYHFFRPAKDVIAQADLMLRKVADAGGFDDNDLPATLDLEDRKSGLSKTALASRAKQWLEYVEKKTGKRPIVYLSPGYSPFVGTSLASYPLWVAHYKTTCPKTPDGWKTWVFWQSTDQAKLAGITANTVDLDVFNGTLAELQQLARGKKKTATVASLAEEPSASDVGDVGEMETGVDAGAEDEDEGADPSRADY